jgi:hypothetical protein
MTMRTSITRATLVLAVAAPLAADQQPAPVAEPPGLYALRAPPAALQGVPLDIGLVRIEGGGGGRESPVSWSEHPVSWFFIRTGATQENFDDAPTPPAPPIPPAPPPVPPAAPPAEAQALAATVQIPIRGVALIGADFQERVILLPAAALLALAKEEGLAAAAETLRDLGDIQAPTQVRVRLVNSAAVLTRARGEAGVVGEQAMSPAIRKSGQAVEIRPLIDPVDSLVGGDIFIRVYLRGAAMGGGRVRATALASGVAQQVATDRSGIGHFTLSEAGGWRLSLRHLARSDADDSGSDWTLYSGTLSFHSDAPADIGGER